MTGHSPPIPTRNPGGQELCDQWTEPFLEAHVDKRPASNPGGSILRYSGSANEDEYNQQILSANLPRYQNPLQYFDPNTVVSPGGLRGRNRFPSRHRVKTGLINF